MVPQVQAIVDPLPSHQLVQEDHLGCYMEQVEQLQTQELVGVAAALGFERGVKLEQLVHPRLPLLPIQLRFTHSEGAELESSPLKPFPDLPRSVEHDRLGKTKW